MAKNDAPADDKDATAGKKNADKKDAVTKDSSSKSPPTKDVQAKDAPATNAVADGSPGPLKPEEDTLWAALAHLGGVVGFLPSLIIFLVLRHRGAKTAIESKEALNWQITFTVGWLVIELLVTIVASIIISAATGLGSHPGNALAYVLSFVPLAVWVVNIVLSVIGFVRVNAGGSYRYPFAVRLIK